MDMFFDTEFRNLIPPLALEERQGLEDSLKREGNHVPIVIWKETKLVLDGHNRYDICALHGIPLKPAMELSFPDRDAAKIWIIDNQLGRRNLPPFPRIALTKLRADILAKKELGKKNESLGGGDRKSAAYRSGLSTLTNPMPPTINTRAAIAKAARVSTGTVAKYDIVEARATAEQKALLVKGEASINEVYNVVTGKAHVGYNNGNNEWYTPAEYIEAARAVMGSIDVDPASTEIGNRTVGAATYFTVADDGRSKQWQGNVWMNPPYAQPAVTEFCNLLVEKYKKGETKQACVLVNNATETNFCQSMLCSCSAVCFIKGRVGFLDKDGKPGAPLQGQTLLYFGENTNEFAAAFGRFGVILYAESRRNS